MNPEEPNPPTTQVTENTNTVKVTTGSVPADSRFFGVSVLAWAMILLTLTVCGCNIFQIPIYDHIVNLSLVITSFYAGAKTSKDKT